jgi:O-antigen chain-terminating methyltransferase
MTNKYKKPGTRSKVGFKNKSNSDSPHFKNHYSPHTDFFDSFYAAFEDRFRGPEETIKDRLKVYLPFLRVLQKQNDPCEIHDLGCGRGEWLELANEEGCLARGVDANSAMHRRCIAKGFDVTHGDLIRYLKTLPDGHAAMISGFHVAEHISIESLLNLVRESFRALKPGGLLVFETPNPESPVVGMTNFYMDPTHRKPLPPPLLAFVTEYFGFVRNKILRLQEPSDALTYAETSLIATIYGVSPDYAIVAQKPAEEKILSSFDQIFQIEHGLDLHTTLKTYEKGFQTDKQNLWREIKTIQRKIHKLSHFGEME